MSLTDLLEIYVTELTLTPANKAKNPSRIPVFLCVSHSKEGVTGDSEYLLKHKSPDLVRILPSGFCQHFCCSLHAALHGKVLPRLCELLIS